MFLDISQPRTPACAISMSDTAKSRSNPLSGVEAYVFDVFGTVVDWYGSVTRALEAFAPASLKGEGKN